MRAILDFLQSRRGAKVAVLCHQRPDGDALGSAVGFAEILSANGYAARAVNPLPFPEYLSFIDPNGMTALHPEPDWHTQYDCAAVLDCGEVGRLEEINQAAVAALPCFTIDHHASSTGVGQIAWIQPDASSTGEMIVQIAEAANWTIPPAAAQALWVAIVTDTGRFSFDNTTVPCLAAAQSCVEQGARPSEAAAKLYQCVSVAERKLQVLVLSRMELLEEGRLAVSWLTRKDFIAAHSGVQDTQNLISLLRDTEGVEAAIFLYEPVNGKDEIKISCRTNARHSCLALVSPFGGGGHERAAGCTLPGSIETARETIVAAARKTFFQGI